MGLDTCAARSEDDFIPDSGLLTTEAEQFLVDIFGEYPQFRGKIYSSSVEKLTGESLYQTWIPPSVVERMLISLERAVRCNPITYDGQIDKQVAVNLIPYFRVCVANNLGLAGSW